MKQLSTTDKTAQKFKTIGQNTAFGNKKNPYRILRYNAPK